MKHFKEIRRILDLDQDLTKKVDLSKLDLSIPYAIPLAVSHLF